MKVEICHFLDPKAYWHHLFLHVIYTILIFSVQSDYQKALSKKSWNKHVHKRAFQGVSLANRLVRQVFSINKVQVPLSLEAIQNQGAISPSIRLVLIYIVFSINFFVFINYSSSSLNNRLQCEAKHLRSLWMCGLTIHEPVQGKWPWNGCNRSLEDHYVNNLFFSKRKMPR